MSITVRANAAMVGGLFSSMNTGLFGNSSGAGFMGGFNFSDYASIRNGSYHKLLDSYYSLDRDGSDSKTSSVAGQDHKYWSLKEANENKKKYNYWDYKTMSTSKEETSKIATLESDAEKLSDAADTLLAKGTKSLFKTTTTTDKDGNKTTKYNTDAIYKAVSNYVTQYNSLIKSAGDSKVVAISSAAASIKGYSSSNAASLSDIGISINDEDKTLALDEIKFKNADMEKVKSLFQGSGSYAYKVSAKASAIDYHAQCEAKKANTYNVFGNYSNNFTSGSMWNSVI